MTSVPARLRAFVLLSMLLLPLVLVACGGGDDDEPETAIPTVTPSPTITPAPTTTAPAADTPVQPTPERTPRPSGGELVDAVIAAVEGQDAARLQGLLHHFLMACTGEQGIGSVPCPAGQAPGAAVTAFGTGTCEGSFHLEGDPEIARAVERFVETERELYAVAVTQPFPGDERIPGQYMVIFRNLDGPAEGLGSAVSVDHEGVTYLHFGCDNTPESFTHGSIEWAIPPN